MRVNNMSEKKQRHQIHIGMRNVKTAAAAALCAFIYLLIDRNPTFACIGAIFGTGKDIPHSWLNGGNRLFGTIIGGLLGMGLFSIYIIFYPQGGFHFLMLPLLFVGVILLILASQYFNWPGAMHPGGMMLCILLFNQPVDTYVAYSLDRILDTAVGVVVALFLNVLLPRERIDRFFVWLCGGMHEPAPWPREDEDNK